MVTLTLAPRPSEFPNPKDKLVLESRLLIMQGLILFTWASTRKAAPQCSQAPLGPKARYVSFPTVTKMLDNGYSLT